jgi:two-component system chemotaxis response regulator CheY
MRAFVVDDSRASRSILRDMLLEVGFDEVDLAGDGVEAIDAMLPDDGEAIDLVLIDLYMPNLDGIELIHAIRNDRRMGDTKLVAISADESLRRIPDALDAGATGYLIKPFTPQRMAVALAGAGLLVRYNPHQTEAALTS